MALVVVDGCCVFLVNLSGRIGSLRVLRNIGYYEKHNE
jgi:hypothetical protein